MDSSTSPSDDAMNFVPGQSKPRRGPSSSSCAECRRLKIRCSGVSKPFPCTSCERRGVAAICPMGVMPERQRRKDKGDHDVLKRRNQILATRVKELEEALARGCGDLIGIALPTPPATDPSTNSPEELLLQPKADDPELLEAFGTLTIEETGRTIWHGGHAPSENFLNNDGWNETCPTEDISLPAELMLLAAGFPMTLPSGLEGAKEAIRTLMPTFEQAASFTEAFFAHAVWLGTPITRSRFFETILNPLYRSTNWENESADRLSLLCGVLAVGCIFDLTREAYSPMAFRLNKLCAACLALAQPLEQPTMTTLEALQCHMFFLQLSDTPTAISRFWSISAVAFRMAIAMGLHRDCRKWGMDPQLENRRRTLFWQLNFIDNLLSIAYGRPRFFNARHYDCPIPESPGPLELEEVTTLRFLFIRDGLIPIIEEGFSVNPPPTYATILKLDQKIRDLPMIDPMKIGVDLLSLSPAQCMQIFCVSGLSQLALLYLHRRYFFEAINSDTDPDFKNHKYGFSVIAAYRAACLMVRQLRALFWKDNNLTERLFFLWLHGFSAFIVLATLVIKMPGCEHAEAIMEDIQNAFEVFQNGTGSRRVQRCLPTVIALRDKAMTMLTLHRNGQILKSPKDEQLDRLLGNAVVVTRTSTINRSKPLATTPPVHHVQASEVDFMALLGVKGTPIVRDPVASDSITPDNLVWNAPAFDIMGNIGEITGGNVDQILNEYFSSQPGLMDAHAPNWDGLLGAI